MCWTFGEHLARSMDGIGSYWSATTYEAERTVAWLVWFAAEPVGWYNKTLSRAGAWCVRGPSQLSVY